MTQSSTWLLEYKKNVHSQTGEDGVIEKILATLPETDKWCVEFGAWDGLHLTNTRYLIETQAYSAILIEADKNRYRELTQNYKNNRDVIAMNKFVGFTAKDSLDQILQSTPIPTDFDLLSIDIDGNDYHVWKAVTRYKPKVVVIEFNPTIPNNVRFVQPADPSVKQGTSLQSLVDLGKDKGYELVSVLPLNAFFVRREYYDRFQIVDNAPEVLRTDLEAVTYLFSGYDGQIFLKGNCSLPWHSIDLIASKMQHLPAFLRTYPEDYTDTQKILFRFYKKTRKRLNKVLTRIRGKIHNGLIR